MTRKAEILLVEDNEGDILLTQKAFEKLKMPHRIYIARDGEAAINMLHKSDDNKDLPDFDLILLDLNLPKKDGKEVLMEVKSTPGLKEIPVVMLSSSKQQMDIIRSYELQANSYIVKPRGMSEFQKIAQAIEVCWFKNIEAMSGARV